MFNREELVCLWFDYNDYSFSKLEKVLRKFDKIDALFDKKLVKNAVFDSELQEIKTNLLSLDEQEFEEFEDEE